MREMRKASVGFRMVGRLGKAQVNRLLLLQNYPKIVICHCGLWEDIRLDLFQFTICETATASLDHCPCRPKVSKYCWTPAGIQAPVSHLDPGHLSRVPSRLLCARLWKSLQFPQRAMFYAFFPSYMLFCLLEMACATLSEDNWGPRELRSLLEATELVNERAHVLSEAPHIQQAAWDPGGGLLLLSSFSHLLCHAKFELL